MFQFAFKYTLRVWHVPTTTKVDDEETLNGHNRAIVSDILSWHNNFRKYQARYFAY